MSQQLSCVAPLRRCEKKSCLALKLYFVLSPRRYVATTCLNNYLALRLFYVARKKWLSCAKILFWSLATSLRRHVRIQYLSYVAPLRRCEKIFIVVVCRNVVYVSPRIAWLNPKNFILLKLRIYAFAFT